MFTGPRGEADLVLDTAALTAAQAARRIASALPGPARALLTGTSTSLNAKTHPRPARAIAVRGSDRQS